MFHYNGFSIIEVIVAVAVISLILTGVVGVSLGAQSMTLSSELSFQATNILRSSSDYLFLYSSEVFSDVGAYFSTSSVDVYDITSRAQHVTECVKNVVGTASWKEGVKINSVSLETFIVDPSFIALSHEPCEGPLLLKNLWNVPVEDSFTLGAWGDVTDIDVVGNLAYVSRNSTIPHEPDLVVFDTHTGSIISEIDIGAGLVAIDATRDYVYGAAYSTSSQLVIVNISSPSNPSLTATASLGLVNPLGSYPQGRSIFYFNNRVYIGTKETAGPELHVFDVSQASSPVALDSLELTHNIHDIVVRDDTVYLATSSDLEELIVVGIDEAGALSFVTSFNAGTSLMNDRDGMSIFILGDVLFLGRKRGNASNEEFYMLHIIDRHNPVFISSLHIDFDGASSYVSGISASGDMVIVSTTDPHKSVFILDISDHMNPNIVSGPHSVTESVVGHDMYDGIYHGMSNMGTLFTLSSDYEHE